MRVHVPNEVRKLRETATMLTTPGLLPPLMVDPFIESFAIHARNLIEFFDGSGAVKAIEFTVASYRAFRTDPIPGALRAKLNTQVAHITRARTDDAAKKLNGPEMGKLYAAINEEVEAFIQHLHPRHAAVWDKPS